jgi:hypothetical protein
MVRWGEAGLNSNVVLRLPERRVDRARQLPSATAQMKELGPERVTSLALGSSLTDFCAVRCGHCFEAESSSPPCLILIIALLPQLNNPWLKVVFTENTRLLHHIGRATWLLLG